MADLAEVLSRIPPDVVADLITALQSQLASRSAKAGREADRAALRRLRLSARDDAIRAAAAHYSGSKRHVAAAMAHDIERLASATLIIRPVNPRVEALRRVLDLNEGRMIGEAHIRDILGCRANKHAA